MPVPYENGPLLFQEEVTDLSRWHHEGIGACEARPGGTMRLHCSGSQQGGPGCMLFFRPDLPDHVAVEYTLTVQSQGGLVINYLAMRGLKGEDLIADASRLAPRAGSMKNYFALKWGLQSYHVSISRFNDQGQHTNTSNWRRNPGCLMVGHGNDPIREIGRPYAIRLIKDAGFLQLYVDGVFAHAAVDRDASRHPIPDWGKFGFRLIGSDVKADVSAFRVYRVQPDAGVRANQESAT